MPSLKEGLFAVDFPASSGQGVVLSMPAMGIFLSCLFHTFSHLLTLTTDISALFNHQQDFSGTVRQSSTLSVC